MKTHLILYLSLIIYFHSQAQQEFNPYSYSIIKSGTFSKAAVATAHPLSSLVGSMIMKKGGNAFDASIAIQLALAVVYPGAGNIGGGGFLLARKKNGQYIALDYRERAPGKARPGMYLDTMGNVLEDASLSGALAAGVPGTVAGLFSTLKFARFPFKMLVQPAIDLAVNGFVITAEEAAGLNDARDEFIKNNRNSAPFVKQAPWKAGDTLVQKDLAKTLRRLQQQGMKDFYNGKTARLIVEDMKAGHGIISYKDLQSYRTKEKKPLMFNYRGYEVISFPPPSSGGILLAQMLKMIEKFPVASYKFQSPGSVQLMTEIERRAYADRSVHIGDPDYYHVPAKTLISEEYLNKRMEDFKSGKAGSSTVTNAGSIKESKETTHISIMDEEGNAVSITTTLNGSFGSKIIVSGAGFILNNEMDDFSVKPGTPNMYGAIGGKANEIQPGKTMLSSMTPTIVLKNHQPYLILGTPGGTTIPTSVFQTIVNIIDFRMNIIDAVNKPKFHHQWLPDDIQVERGFSQETAEELQKMGYKITETPQIGRMEIIEIEKNSLKACGDNRGNDSVSGY